MVSESVDWAFPSTVKVLYLRGIVNDGSMTHIQSLLQWLQSERAVSLETCCAECLPYPLCPLPHLASCSEPHRLHPWLLWPLTSRMNLALGRRLREGRNVVRVLSPCWLAEVTLGWLKVTASLKVVLSTQLSLWSWGITILTLAPSGVGWSCSC